MPYHIHFTSHLPRELQNGRKSPKIAENRSEESKNVGNFIANKEALKLCASNLDSSCLEACYELESQRKVFPRTISRVTAGCNVRIF